MPGVETVDSLVAVTCLRAAGEEEGAKYIYTALHSITQHPRTVVTLLPTISEQQSPNTIYSIVLLLQF